MKLHDLASDPAAFRNAILIDVDGHSTRLAEVMDDWQAADFAAIDPALKRAAGRSDKSGTRFAWLERPRGHSKTSDEALSALWLLFASRNRIKGVAAAADKEQAGILRDAIQRLLDLNPWLDQIIEVQAWRVLNTHTRSELTITSSDVASSWGTLADFIILDEVTHWRQRDLFDSLFSAADKRASCVLVSICNAGFTQSWAWEVRETVRVDADWHFSCLDGPQATWITPDRLARQKRLLPDIAYRRLWLNEWTSGSGDALDRDDIAASITLDAPLSAPEPGWAYVAGVDIGLSRDASAVVVVGRHVGRFESFTKPRRLTATQAALIDAGIWDEPIEDENVDRIEEPTGRLKLAAVRIWKPSTGQRVSLEGVERTIRRLNETFHLSCIGFDPWNAAMLRERLAKAGIQSEDVPFTGQNLQSMCSAVLETFRDRNIDLFQEDQLLTDLRNLRVAEKSYGVRLESPRGPDGHGDAATALAIALHLVRTSGIALAPSVAGYRLLTYPHS